MFKLCLILLPLSIIINIDTAIETSSVCIAVEGKMTGIKINPSAKESAGWIHTAIKNLLQETGYELKDLDAIAVSAGPGSYTGLRVGMATAKGLCYALQIPLIAVNTLQMMAAAAINEPTDYLCPMIDARRMEVFTAVYDKNLNTILSPKNMILTEKSFSEQLKKGSITFFGNGCNKFQSVVNSSNAFFKNIVITAEHMAIMSKNCYQNKKFVDLAFSEPFYGKEFYTPANQEIHP